MPRLTVLAASIAVALAAVLASASSQAATQGRWVIRDLGTLGGAKESRAEAINERGQILIWSGTLTEDKEYYTNVHHALWLDGKKRDLGEFYPHWNEPLNDWARSSDR